MHYLRGLIASAGALWSTRDNRVFYGDTEYRIKGVSMQGFEFNTMSPSCMHVHDLDFYLDFLTANGFNSIRVPFSYELTRNLDTGVPYPTALSAEPALQDKTLREILHTVISRSRDRGISVLLDLHNINSVITEYPWTADVDEGALVTAWDRMMEFAVYPNVIGVDIKNEPHDIGWNVWGPFVNRFIEHVTQQHPDFKGLFFVEGLNDGAAPWAGSFASMSDGDIVDKSRVVWSPHAYGPSVRGKVAITEGADQFMQWWGFLKTRYTNPIVLGEFGGYMTQSDLDLDWHDRLRSFLLEQDITDSFYWTLFPDSRDTGGLFQSDCTSVNYDKVRFLATINPNPTLVDFTKKQNKR